MAKHLDSLRNFVQACVARKVTVDSSNVLVWPDGKDCPIFPHNKKITKVFARPCFEDMTGIVFGLRREGENGVVIEGTPGIGKSVFLLYLLWRLLEETDDIIILRSFHLGEGETNAVIIDRERNIEVKDYNDETVAGLLYDRNVVFLNDGLPMKISSAYTVIVTSPDQERALYHQIAKQSSFEYVYMPPWTLQELLQLGKITNVPPEQIIERYKVVGGSARLIFSAVRRDVLMARVDHAVPNDLTALNDLLRTVRDPSDLQGKTYRVVHIVPLSTDSGTDYFMYSLSFASQYVMERINHNVRKASQAGISEICTSLSAAEETWAPSVGYFFQQLALSRLTDGGCFRVRRLFGTDQQKSSDECIEFPPLKRVDVHNVSDIAGHATENSLVVPTVMNAAAVDAVMFDANRQPYAVQVTVGNTHTIALAGIKQLNMPNVKHLPFLFVVPEKSCDIFGEQMFDANRAAEQKDYDSVKMISQWAVAMPYNMQFFSTPSDGATPAPFPLQKLAQVQPNIPKFRQYKVETEEEKYIQAKLQSSTPVTVQLLKGFARANGIFMPSDSTKEMAVAYIMAYFKETNQQKDEAVRFRRRAEELSLARKKHKLIS